jgi:hypothetical protein
MTFDGITDLNAKMAGSGNFAGIFAQARATGPVDGGKELGIARLLNSPDDRAAHAPTDAANDQT